MRKIVIWEQSIENKTEKLNNKLFKCVWLQCRYKTNTKSLLKHHIVIQFDEKLYKCDHKDCNKSFKIKRDLKRQKFTHSGIKLKCVWPQCKYETIFLKI